MMTTNPFLPSRYTFADQKTFTTSLASPVGVRDARIGSIHLMLVAGKLRRSFVKTAAGRSGWTETTPA